MLSEGARATLSGRILDSSGAVIPGADVQIRNTATKHGRDLKSGAEGQFVFPSVEPSRYEIVATQTGCQRRVETGIQLEVGQAAHLDINLAPGSISETVEVSAKGFSNIGAKGSTIQSRPPIHAMQEFKMQVLGYSAGYGRPAAS